MAADEHLVTSVDQLEALYGKPSDLARQGDRPHRAGLPQADRGRAVRRHRDQRPRGLDCSPKGDAAGFVRISTTDAAIPDRPGNNRLDGFSNILCDPRIALLFLIPAAARRCG